MNLNVPAVERRFLVCLLGLLFEGSVALFVEPRLLRSEVGDEEDEAIEEDRRGSDGKDFDDGCDRRLLSRLGDVVAAFDRLPFLARGLIGDDCVVFPASFVSGLRDNEGEDGMGARTLLAAPRRFLPESTREMLFSSGRVFGSCILVAGYQIPTHWLIST